MTNLPGTGETVPLVITGATGRIGRILCALWRQAPPPGLRPMTAGRQPGNDLVWDMAAGPADLPPGAVILHLAAVLGRDPQALAGNAVMAGHLATAARQAHARRVLFVSTAAVYGRLDRDADETDPAVPLSPYGQAKLQAEVVIRQALGDQTPGDQALGRAGLSILRVGNVPGVDALLGGAGGRPIVLDPVPGADGGPLRSWIGPVTLARVLADLIATPALPAVLNVAQPGPLPMAALLDAAGLPWLYGPANPGVLARATLSVDRLAARLPVPRADAADLVAEWRNVQIQAP